jgi:hypothetical protein
LGPGRTGERGSVWKLALNTYRTLHNTDDINKIIKSADGEKQVTDLLKDLVESGDKTQSSMALRNFLDKHINDVCNNTPIQPEEKLSCVERLSKSFPKQRARVVSLKDDQQEETDDPSTMAGITKRYWEKHYILKQLTVKNLSRFWRKHYTNKLIDTNPEAITVEMVEQVILESGDTSPGPDNIPFSAYKALASIAAPVFLGVIKQLMKGVLPPQGFNNAIFHLLPKKGTGWIDDTRPLSVSNTSNRIIASV